MEFKERIYSKLFANENYENILDIGASVYTINILKKFFPHANITGINIEIRHKIPEIIYGNAEAIQFSNEAFDLIFCLQTLEHIVYPDKFISESWRVLKFGGSVILDTPNLNSLFNRILLPLGYPPTNYTPYPGHIYGLPFNLKQEWDHPRVFPFKTLKEIFNSNGFKLKAVTGTMELAQGRKLRTFRQILDKILPISYKDSTIIKAVKI